jgi:Tol biopolymer transport system component
MPRLPLFRSLALALIGASSALSPLQAFAAERTEAGVICPVEAAPASHSWSPDSRRIVFAGADGGINFLSVRFGAANPMTETPFVGHPIWEPAGDRIAVLQPEGASDSDLAYATLYMWSPAASKPAALAGGLSARMIPIWSPDGARLLAQTVDGDLITIDSRSGAKKLIFDHDTGDKAGLKGQPAWVSGNEVIYQVGAGALFIADVDTGALKRFKGPGSYTAFHPTSDGIWAALIEDKKPLLTLLQDGKVIRTIAAPVSTFSGPNPKGKIAAQFYAAPGLRLIDAATGLAAVLTQNSGDSAPVLSPDGKAVSFSRRDAATDAVHLCIAVLR